MPKPCPAPASPADAFWRGFAALIADLAPRNKALLDKRDDAAARDRCLAPGQSGQADRHGCLYANSCAASAICEPEPPDFAIATENVDPEIASIAGPQLVVPVTNARYALNAANARWGSLYDALYGTDAIPEDGGATRGPGYNSVRGTRVIAKARQFLDQAAPLAIGSHRDATRYAIDDGRLSVTLKDNARHRPGARRRSSSAIAAPATDPSAILLKHNGLHIEIVIDRARPIGKQDAAGVADVVLEAAITTIQDCEDFGRLRRCRGQGRGLSQLARPDARHAGRDVRQGRPHGHPPPGHRSRLHRTGWRHAHACPAAA